MNNAKNCKILKNNMKKRVKTAENAKTTAKYASLPRGRFVCKIERLLKKYNTYYPEYTICKNIDKLKKCERVILTKNKTKLKMVRGKIAVFSFCENVLKGFQTTPFNLALKEELKNFTLLKKEIKVLRRVFIYCALEEILKIEKRIYLEKKNIKKGKVFTGKFKENMPAGFYFGLVKNKNLGLYLDNKKEIVDGVDLLICDFDYYKARLAALINLLIKCLK